MGMPTTTLTAHLSTAELGQRYRAARCPLERSHLQIVWLLSQGRSEREVAAVTGYGQRWIAEVVFTQMTKMHLLAAGAKGDDVADLDFAASDTISG